MQVIVFLFSLTSVFYQFLLFFKLFLHLNFVHFNNNLLQLCKLFSLKWYKIDTVKTTTNFIPVSSDSISFHDQDDEAKKKHMQIKQQRQSNVTIRMMKAKQ